MLCNAVQAFCVCTALEEATTQFRRRPPPGLTCLRSTGSARLAAISDSKQHVKGPFDVVQQHGRLLQCIEIHASCRFYDSGLTLADCLLRSTSLIDAQALSLFLSLSLPPSLARSLSLSLSLSLFAFCFGRREATSKHITQSLDQADVPTKFFYHVIRHVFIINCLLLLVSTHGSVHLRFGCRQFHTRTVNAKVASNFLCKSSSGCIKSTCRTARSCAQLFAA